MDYAVPAFDRQGLNLQDELNPYGAPYGALRGCHKRNENTMKQRGTYRVLAGSGS